ncbi:aminodeoxychorismate synthase component I [Maribacter sp. 2307ULW6-5]|uniref:aminodeoxychorismate synthase component I n=1 Tax=Maribacter sp. 2307ULW6-5 TaxID=3386275 RepID=UPI0039BD7635
MFQERTTALLKQGTPFFFLVDFAKQNQEVLTFGEAAAAGIFFNVKGTTNRNRPLAKKTTAKTIALQPNPIGLAAYRKAFDQVKWELGQGNSFLLNLTFATPIAPNVPLKEIYDRAHAPFKLYYKDRFVVFSPESYFHIKGDHIHSHPMKGTISTDVPQAEQRLLENAKEMYEHNTIVDLIRNDLSMIAKNVEVTKFRYLERIKSTTGEILQTSSEIKGRLPADWKDHFADLLLKTLPAGSISGAPKKKTMDIIAAAETSARGFYTGIFGVFDGENLASAVNIRYIEKKKGQHYFRSGGGITHLSQLEEEYEELNHKIYVPTF